MCCVTNIIVSALWMRNWASNWRPKGTQGCTQEPAGRYLPWAGSEPWGCGQKLQTHRISHCSCTAISRELWALNKHTNKTNIHCHQQLPAYSQQGREGTCRKTCEPSLNIIKHHWAAGSPPHFGSPSHDTCPFSLSIGFCDPVVEHNPLGRSPGISRQISPEKMKFVFADAP